MTKIKRNQKNQFNVVRIVFWEPCTSPHKEDFFSSLVNIAPQIEVICCADSKLSDDRKSLGWLIVPNNKFQTIISPTTEEINLLVKEKLDTTLHVFSGLRRVPTIVAAIKAVKKFDAKFAIWHEPRVCEGWKGKLRFIQSWITEGWFRKHVEFVLAIGRNGPDWFKSVGYPASRIFPFAYFVDSLQKSNNDLLVRNDQEAIHIGYVGRFVKEKGVFDLVDAVGKLGKSAHLHFVGTGIEESAIKNACDNLNIAAEFHGVMPLHKVHNFMQQLDVLVLASTTTDDGWGVVVSEALMSGTAVIATTVVGASVVLGNKIFGRYVPIKAPDKIANAIIELKLSGAFLVEQRKKRAAYASQCLSADAGANKLLEIIDWSFGNIDRPATFYEIQIK